MIENYNNRLFISIINKNEFVEKSFIRVKMNYKTREKKMYVFIIFNNMRAKNIKNKDVYIYKFNIINIINEIIIKKKIILNKEINYYSNSRRN